MERAVALLWSNVALMFGLVAQLEGMKALNQEREALGQSLAYDEEAFLNIKKKFNDLAIAIEQLGQS